MSKTPQYDVALSFAGEQRLYAARLTKVLRAAGVRVFYDGDEKAVLWGKNLYDYLHDIYCNKARFCVVFVSAAYARKRWTTHERKAAQERVLREVTSEYLLPIKMDDTELPGLPATVGYVSITDGIEEIARTLLRKLRDRPSIVGERKITERTRRGYARAFSIFEEWARQRDLPCLPTTPDVVMNFLSALAAGTVGVHWIARNGAPRSSGSRKTYGTIEYYYGAIIHAHRSAGHEWPHAHPGIVRVKKDIRRRLGTAKRKVTPLQIGMLKAGFAKYKPSPPETEARDKAMLAVGFYAAMRRSELVALRVEDLCFTPKGLFITIPKSKPVAVPSTKDKDICPVRLTKKWLAILKDADIDAGPLFRRVDLNGCIGNKSLHPQSVRLVVKRFVECAGFAPEDFGTHSLRAGFATSAAAKGKSLHSIMRQTRHRSARIAMTYTGRPATGHAREDALFDDNAASEID